VITAGLLATAIAGISASTVCGQTQDAKTANIWLFIFVVSR
jgi:hypothetical protein